MFKSPLVYIALFCTLLITPCYQVSAQVTPIEKITDAVAQKAILYMNQGLPDSVYTLAGEKFKQQITSELWRSVYKTQFSSLLPITQLQFLSSKDGVNKYKLHGKLALVFMIGLDEQGKLKEFLFQPYQQEITTSAMTDLEKKTDALAKKILPLINQKQADSIYLYAGEYFKSKIDAVMWKSIAEKGLFPLTPLPQPVFVSSKNGINKYKLGQYQFILGLDKEDKFSALALQPYYEEAVKTAKASSDNPMKYHLDSLAERVLSAYIQTSGNVGISAGIWLNDKAYYYNYGETHQGNGRLPTMHTLYDIGSITKTFTSTLLAIAVSQGKVQLSTSIISLLPDSVASNGSLKEITLEELANHTSGLPRLAGNMKATVTDVNQPYANYSNKELFSYLKQFKSTRKPGAQYEYSNLGAALLGVLLERIYHRSYQQLITKYIIGPAQLNETYFFIGSSQAGLLAQGYNEQGGAVPSWSFLAMQAAGALKSSASDLLKYGKLQLNPVNPILTKALKLTRQITFKDGINTVGLGWHYLPETSPVLQHSGGTGGYRSMLCIDLERHIVIAVLTNNATTGDALGIHLMKAVQTVAH